MAAGKNISRWSPSTVQAGTHVVATHLVDAAGNVDPVLIPVDELGGEGPAGAPGSVARFGAGVPSNALGVNGDYYTNNTTGDVYAKAAGVYTFQYNNKGVAGNTGPQGAGLIPDGYGILNEAKVTAVQTADVNYVFVVDPDGDDRANQSLPAGIAGDKSLHIIRYDATTNAWTDFGQFTGVQGQQGNPGNPGTPGNNGTDGVDGVDGKSAYQVWLDNGGSGSEAVYLASLKGDKGDDGDPGTAGADGDAVYGVDVFRNAGVATGGYWVTPRASFAKSFTKFYGIVYGGSGTFDAKLYVNGAVVYTKTGITTAGFEATGLTLPIAVNDAVYIEITPSGGTVQGVWAEFS